jgi:hypothetical protein
MSMPDLHISPNMALSYGYLKAYFLCDDIKLSESAERTHFIHDSRPRAQENRICTAIPLPAPNLQHNLTRVNIGRHARLAFFGLLEGIDAVDDGAH